MRRILYELATEYAEATGCTCDAVPGSCRATIVVEGFSVHIGLVEETGMMLFQTGVASLPSGGDGREEFCLKLLAANNLFGGTMGFTLGVDKTHEAVTMQIAWDALHLDKESFSRIVNNLISVSLNWMLRLEDWRASPSEKENSESEESFMLHCLKV